MVYRINDFNGNDIDQINYALLAYNTVNEIYHKFKDQILHKTILHVGILTF